MGLRSRDVSYATCIVCRSKDGTNQPWRRGSGEIRAWLVINLNLILLIEGI